MKLMPLLALCVTALGVVFAFSLPSCQPGEKLDENGDKCPGLIVPDAGHALIQKHQDKQRIDTQIAEDFEDGADTEKKKCKKSFGDCKSEQINSIPFVDTCKEKLKCGGADSKEDAEKQLKALTPLSDALKQTGFADAMQKLGLTSGPGSDGVLPTSRTNLRVSRQTEGEGCKTVLDNWKKFNASGDAGVPGTEGDLDETKINETVETLNTLNTSPSLEADLDSCQKESSRQTVTLAIVRIRFYVFWCGWFQVQVVEIKITIITITFGITATTTTTAAPVTTVAPSGRNLKKMFQKNHLIA